MNREYCCICNLCGSTVFGSTRDKDCAKCLEKQAQVKSPRTPKRRKRARAVPTTIQKTALKREVRRRGMRSTPATIEALDAGLVHMLSGVLGDAALLTEYGGRKTIQRRDLVFATKLSQRK